MPPTDVVVPAHNEAAGIAAVLEAIASAPGVARLIVVLDDCTDGTAEIARTYASELVSIAAGNKGSAMAAGLERTGTDTVAFIDADLIGLRPEHVSALCSMGPPTGQLVGLRGDVPKLLGALPSISGERRVPAALARSVKLAGAGWRAETILNAAIARARLPWKHIRLEGVSNPSKAVSSPLGLLEELLDVAYVAAVFAPELLRYVLTPQGAP
jgi:glycosyltransferase involved in cell wall biosynthesis